jgi:hypothetical protein
MPTVTADKIIGKGLIAKITVPKLNSSLIKIGEFKPGDPIGVVYSYIQRGTKLYWLFDEPGTNKPPYLVEHGSRSFVLTDDIRNAIREQEGRLDRELREQEIANKGVIPYYIEKYGKWLVLIIAGTVIIKTLINKK